MSWQRRMPRGDGLNFNAHKRPKNKLSTRLHSRPIYQMTTAEKQYALGKTKKKKVKK